MTEKPHDAVVKFDTYRNVQRVASCGPPCDIAHLHNVEKSIIILVYISFFMIVLAYLLISISVSSSIIVGIKGKIPLF